MGSVIPIDQKRRIVQLAEKHRVTIIEDDLYGDLYFGPKRPPALKAFDTGDWVIHCGSYSKALAPGLRVGWILPGSRYHRVKNLKYATSLSNASVSEMVVAAFLKTGGVDRHLRRTRQILAQQTLQIRETILREFPEGTRVSSPKGGFVLWCEMPDGFDSEKFSIAALKRKISIVPGTLFSASRGLQNSFRVSCGSPLDNRSQRAIGILARLAASQL
jgi:DNA-binding transcriptional MocR family regulator